jgi:cystathionine beta-lyase/cystathionine gamma-synthase
MTSRIKPNEHRQASLETLLIHVDRELNATSCVAPPIYQTSTFRGQSAEDFAERSVRPRHSEYYTRCGNPTLAQVESVLAAVEGAESALVTASGMGAITVAALSFLGHGAHVVAQTNHYASTHDLLQSFLPRFGIQVTRVDQTSPAEFEKAMQPNTKLLLLESPSNPTLKLTDLRAVGRIARDHGALTLIDNSFATPVNQRPLELGIDLVVHSATKYFGGHSDLIAGVVMGGKTLIEKIWNNHVIVGAVLGPFDAWLLLRGLRTLSLRVRQQNENALGLAQFLAQHPAVKAVHYPGLPSHPQHVLARQQMTGFGGMLSFDLKGGHSAAKQLLNNLRIPSLASSLGGVETLVVHAATNFAHEMTAEHAESIGITPGLVRVSVGVEAKSDLVADFEQALAKQLAVSGVPVSE